MLRGTSKSKVQKNRVRLVQMSENFLEKKELERAVYNTSKYLQQNRARYQPMISEKIEEKMDTVFDTKQRLAKLQQCKDRDFIHI
jgi:hypothetical protein